MGQVIGLGAGGRPRKPTALKEIQGTARKDRANPREPDAQPIVLAEPPEGLPDEERDIWRELAGLVDPLRVASASDRAAFRSMVQALCLERAAFRENDVDGWVKADAKWEKWASHFGLTPATRSRVNRLGAEQKKADPLDEFAGE